MENLKLSKQIISAANEAGIESPREVQEKTISRIIGGQDLVVAAPENSGKTTALVLGTLAKLKYSRDVAPRALILVSDKEQVQELLARFETLGKNTGLRVIGIWSGAGIEAQRDALAAGTDVVIGTPDRVLNIYQKSGLNINKLSVFCLDDADKLLQKGFQTQIKQLTESLPKCQHLIFTTVYHGKLQDLASLFMNFPAIIEIEVATEITTEIIPQKLFLLPNYKNKVNLLKLLLSQNEEFSSTIVFTNTSQTAENISKSLNSRFPGEIAVLKNINPDLESYNNVNDFAYAASERVLLASNENGYIDTDPVSVLIHFDIPQNLDLVVERIKSGGNHENKKNIFLTTDLELPLIKKVEQITGHTIAISSFPEDFIIEETTADSAKNKSASDSLVEEKGKAFHEKKPENSKDYNYKYKDRLKLFGKKNRKNKRLK